LAIFRTISVVVSLALLSLVIAAGSPDYLLYVGSFTNPPSASKGIYVFRFESASAKLTPLGLAAETTNPSFLAEHPNHRFLYAVHNNRGLPDNSVSAFSIDRNTGKLTFLNKVDAAGEGPAHVTLDRTNHWLAVSNYGSGTVAILPVRPDGTLGSVVSSDQHKESGADNPRQARAHMGIFSPDNRFLIVADVGIDRVYIYRFDASKGAITAADTPFVDVTSSAGARHLAFDPKGATLYVNTERGSTVEAFRYSASTGALSKIAALSTLPADFSGRSSGAEIGMTRNGRFVYASNRGHDSITIFAVNPDHSLKFMETVSTQGKTPRNFALDPSGAFLIAGNEGSNSLVVFRVDEETGKLRQTGPIVPDTPGPACLIFVPAQ